MEDNYYHLPLVAISVTICLTNCLVITLFLTQSSLRSAGNYLLFSLAISDLAVGLVGIPVNIACEKLLTWGLCLSSYSVNRFIAVSSIFHILWITLEKYSAILYPLRHKSQFDRSKVKYICVSTWLGAILLSVIELSWLTSHGSPHADYSEEMERKQIIYNTFIFVAVFVLPILVMAFAYTGIFRTILRQHSREFLRRHVPREERALSLHTRVSREVRTALLFFVMLLVFILAWFWWFFAIIYFYIFTPLYLSHEVFRLFVLVRFTTSFVNPMLYTFFKRDFNKALKKLTNRSRLTPEVPQRSLITAAVSHSASDGTITSSSQALKGQNESGFHLTPGELPNCASTSGGDIALMKI